MPTPLTKLIQKSFQRNHPVYASLELTYVCNLHCRFCYNPVQRKGQNRVKPAPVVNDVPLSFEEIVSALDQLQALGVLYLTLTGGEPMLHPRFWQIAAEAKKRSFALRIFTNGIAINEEIADRLETLCPYVIEISIHGSNAQTAEALNQVPGSHRRLMKALRLLRERNVRAFVKCVVTKLVENELEEIKAIGDQFGYPVFFDPILTPSDDAENYPLELKASDDAIRRLFESEELNVGNSPFERTPEQFNCSVATGTVNIDPYGYVNPCIQWRQNVGNIRKQPLKEIWENSQELESIRALNRKLPMILKELAPDSQFCSHCPGLSLVRYGDPERPEEQHLRVARIRAEAYDLKQRRRPSIT